MTKPLGLYVNCKPANCSIYESGVMFARSLKDSDAYDLAVAEVDSFDAISRSYDFYVFNYHHVTMEWLAPHRIRELPGVKIAFVLEMEQHDPFVLCPDVFDAYCIPDPTLACPDPRVHAFGRPLEVVTDLPAYVDTDVPVIGSFGFATPGKGFEFVVHAANREFDRAIVRLNMPPATFADPGARRAQVFAGLCREVAKPGIDVQADHTYLEKDELIEWCAQNTINVFFYDRRLPGLSATTDQAITAGRPLLVSPCDTFRHIHPYITPYPGTTLRDAIETTMPRVQEMQRDWHPDRFRERFEGVLHDALEQRAATPAGTAERVAREAARRDVVHTGPARINLAILTHNALEHTKSCLTHLRRNTGEPYRIFIFDNASSDGTREYLEGLTDPRIEVRFCDENLGVAGGRNALIEWLLPEVPEDGFLVFLDNDIDVHEGWATPFLRLFDEQPGAGIASREGSLMLIHSDRRQLFKTPEQTSAVDTASGGFACWMRRQVCVDVGRFDEKLGTFWQEDDDYAVRAIQRGWEVFAVPESPMWHHEHGSEVAHEDLAIGGSRDNARYLAEKWRAAGYVDEDGWIIHQNSTVYLPVAVRRELQQRLGHQCSFNRQEFASALTEVHAVIANPAGREMPRQVISRLHHVLMDMFETESRATDPDLASQVGRAHEALRAIDLRADLTRRLAAELPPAAEPRGATRLSKLCTSEDWDDPAWRHEAEQIFVEPSGPAYHHRTKDIWLQVQMQRGLRDLGCLSGSSVGLFYMAGRRPVLWSLTNHVRKLVAADNYSDRQDREMIEDPQSVAPVPFSHDRLEVVDTQDMPFEDGAFDFVCAPYISDLGPVGIIKGAQEAARVTRPGGVVVLGYSARIDADETELTPRNIVTIIRAASKCELIEEPDFRLSEQTLEGMYDGDWNFTRVPYLLHCKGKSVLTAGLIFLTKPIVVSPQRPPAQPTGQSKAPNAGAGRAYIM